MKTKSLGDKNYKLKGKYKYIFWAYVVILIVLFILSLIYAPKEMPYPFYC